MGATYHGFPSRTAYERELRRSFAAVDTSGFEKWPGLECQHRGVEICIRFAMFVADEMHDGTPADIILGGGSRLLGNMVENLAGAFDGAATESIVAEIFRRMAWQTTPDQNDVVVEPGRFAPQGGSA